MKILILNGARKFTGEAAHCLDLIEQLRLHGHDASLVGRRDSLLLKNAGERNVPAAAELHLIGGIQIKRTLQDFWNLRRLIREVQPDIIHCHRGNDHGLAVAVTRTLRSKPAIIRTRHRVVPVKYRFGNRWLFRSATQGVICVSRRAAESFGRMLPSIQHKLTIIYSSVDTDKFHPDKRNLQWRRENGVADDEPLIGLIARLQRVKGQDKFLRAAAIVSREFPKARFLIAGSGPPHKRARIEQDREELGLDDRLIVRDWLPDVPAVSASLDIGVLASLGSEASSRVTYEYMASGAAVIATSVGCIPEIIRHGETGMVVTPGDSDDLANAMLQALRFPEQRIAMRDQAYRQAQDFHNRDRWIKETLGAYEKALGITRSQDSDEMSDDAQAENAAPEPV